MAKIFGVEIPETPRPLRLKEGGGAVRKLRRHDLLEALKAMAVNDMLIVDEPFSPSQFASAVRHQPMLEDRRLRTFIEGGKLYVVRTA